MDENTCFNSQNCCNYSISIIYFQYVQFKHWLNDKMFIEEDIVEKFLPVHNMLKKFANL